MLYRIHPETKVLQALNEIEFAQHAFKERYDIQEWVASTPEILGEDLLIIAKEFTGFEGTRERPDLIAVDRQGNIVIIELKRDHSGNDVYLQAIKYASYWSRFQAQHVIATYHEYLAHQGQSEENAEQLLLDFLELDSLETINKNQRIILVSHRFSRELITTVDWLQDKYALDMRCIQLIPYYDPDLQTYYLQRQQLLPVPGVDQHFIQPAIRDLSSPQKESPKIERDARHTLDQVSDFYEQLLHGLQASPRLLPAYKPNKKSRHAGKYNQHRYMRYWYNQGLWKNLKLCYHFLVKYEAQAWQHTIGLCLFLDYLYAKGVSVNQVKAFCHELEQLSHQHAHLKWVYTQASTSYELHFQLRTPGLGENDLEQVQIQLENLITLTYPLVQKYLIAQQESV